MISKAFKFKQKYSCFSYLLRDAKNIFEKKVEVSTI